MVRECHSFLSQLATAKVRGEAPHLRARARQAWFSRCTMLACSAARAVAVSLLERRGGQGSDGVTPSTSDVLADASARLGERPWACASLFLSYHPFLMSTLSLSLPRLRQKKKTTTRQQQGFAIKPFLARTLCCLCARRDAFSFCSQVRRRSMPRRGWTAMDSQWMGPSSPWIDQSRRSDWWHQVASNRHSTSRSQVEVDSQPHAATCALPIQKQLWIMHVRKY